MPDKDQVVKRLAREHFEAEPSISKIFRVNSMKSESNPAEPIKLLEVNEDTIPSGIIPLGFDSGPGSGIPFPSIIIEITPYEFNELRNERLKLPEDWVIGEELFRGEFHRA